MSKGVPNTIFKIKTEADFEKLALNTFAFQYTNNPVYQNFCKHLGRNPKRVKTLVDIPFLPIEFFKTKKIITGAAIPKTVFTSSGTTGQQTSQHLVHDISIYEQSFTMGFERFYGRPTEYCILALLPAYLERKGSSLIYMVDWLMKSSNHPDNGFFLYDFESLKDKLMSLEQRQQKTILIGVSFALMDFVEQYPLKLKNTIVMETGGMKGRKKEITREELHRMLGKGFGIHSIHSEYGMTELLSQAYSQGHGVFKTPPWMQILTRDTEDPLSFQEHGKTGGINVIDLANLYSCSFIATQDLGRTYKNGTFEVLGRFDHSDVRGCNLMAI